MTQNNEILALLKAVLERTSSIEESATQRHTYYSKSVEDHKKTIISLVKDVNELKSIIKATTAEIDKRISINELTFENYKSENELTIKNLKSEIKKDMANTRLYGAVGGFIMLLLMGILVSWYAKQPPQDINPLAVVKQLPTKPR